MKLRHAARMLFSSVGLFPLLSVAVQICLDHSLLRGSLTLLHDIYLPNAAPMYKSLHAIVARDRPSLIIMDTACESSRAQTTGRRDGVS